MRTTSAACFGVLIVLAGAAALAVSPPDVTFDGGSATCVHTPNGDFASGSAAAGGPIWVDRDSGTITINAVGTRAGKPTGDACTFDVVITGAEAVGVAALSPQAGVSGATSAPCSAVQHDSCVASASASWFVDGLGTHVRAAATADPASRDVGLDASFETPNSLPGTALGVQISFEIGVTDTTGARTVVATGSVTILDTPLSVGLNDVSLP